MVARVREDRLLRWSAYAAVPFVWFALALVNPVFLLGPLLVAGALWLVMRRGLVERHDPEEEPELF
jgi:hypothetical protein